MTPKAVLNAIKETERFVKAARALLATQEKKDAGYFYPSKEGGACRRASMDLTRALAEMRRKQWD